MFKSVKNYFFTPYEERLKKINKITDKLVTINSILLDENKLLDEKTFLKINPIRLSIFEDYFDENRKIKENLFSKDIDVVMSKEFDEYYFKSFDLFHIVAFTNEFYHYFLDTITPEFPDDYYVLLVDFVSRGCKMETSDRESNFLVRKRGMKSIEENNHLEAIIVFFHSVYLLNTVKFWILNK